MSKIKVNGMLDKSSDCLLYYWAPRCQEQSYSDTVMPYNNMEQAYDNSSNVGVTTCDNNGMFEILLDNCKEAPIVSCCNSVTMSSLRSVL